MLLSLLDCTDSKVESCTTPDSSLKMEAEKVKENCFKVPDTGGGDDGDTSSDMELGSESSLQGELNDF